MSGKKRIAGITYVLDEFHLKKYLKKITRCFRKKKGTGRRTDKDHLSWNKEKI